MNPNLGRGPGRPVGSKNKATESVREEFLKIVKSNNKNLNKWILQTAEKDPAKAVELIVKLSHFVLPQLQKIELTGEDGKEILSNIRFEFGINKDIEPKGDE